MKIEWRKGNKIDSGSLDKIETIWRVKLPEDFKEIVLSHNKGRPNLNVFNTTESKGRVFGGLLNFDLNEKVNVLSDYQILKERLPERIFPFAEDPGGNFICFDYRNNESIPQIILWNHEGIVINERNIFKCELVSNSFSKFISQLYKTEAQSGFDFSQFEILE